MKQSTSLSYLRGEREIIKNRKRQRGRLYFERKAEEKEEE